MQDIHSTRCYLVVLIRLFSLCFCSRSLISKGLFSFLVPHELETRFLETIDLSEILEACLQSEYFPLQKLAKTIQGAEERRQEWWLQSLEGGPTRRADLGRWGPEKVRLGCSILRVRR